MSSALYGGVGAARSLWIPPCVAARIRAEASGPKRPDEDEILLRNYQAMGWIPKREPKPETDEK